MELLILSLRTLCSLPLCCVVLHFCFLDLVHFSFSPFSRFSSHLTCCTRSVSTRLTAAFGPRENLDIALYITAEDLDLC